MVGSYKMFLEGAMWLILIGSFIGGRAAKGFGGAVLGLLGAFIFLRGRVRRILGSGRHPDSRQGNRKNQKAMTACYRSRSIAGVASVFWMTVVAMLSACGHSSNPGGDSPQESQQPSSWRDTAHRLTVRGIGVRMKRAEILAAAQAAGMQVRENRPTQLKIADPTASGKPVGGDSGSGGAGLVLVIDFKDDLAVSINVTEQGAMRGEVFEDLSKKWGKPEHLPPDYNNELGTQDQATWGDKGDVYAVYNPSIYSYGAQSVTIRDALAFALAPQKRKGVAM